MTHPLATTAVKDKKKRERLVPLLSSWCGKIAKTDGGRRCGKVVFFIEKNGDAEN